MTTVPLTQCCHLLAIDAKTLRQWLKHAGLSLHAHPTDARIKGLTMQQVQQLATLHGRSLKLDAVASPLLDQPMPTPLPPSNQMASVQTMSTLAPDPDLIGKLSCLEARMATMQQQLTQLALELLQERQYRLLVNATLIGQSGQEVCSPEIQASLADPIPLDAPKSPGRPLHPAELRARSRVLPLIEYGADGSYVIIDPLLGECHFLPDSAAWFDWLATLSSFRFVGLQGRFTASRGGSRCSPKRTWFASRFFHARKHRRYLAVTDRLSIDRLEHVAAELHAHIVSL